MNRRTSYAITAVLLLCASPASSTEHEKQITADVAFVFPNFHPDAQRLGAFAVGGLGGDSIRGVRWR